MGFVSGTQRSSRDARYDTRRVRHELVSVVQHSRYVAFDYQGFRRAFCAKDFDAWAGFFTDDAEWVEYRHTKPPRDPNVMRGRQEIEAHLRLVCESPVEFEMSDEVLDGERAAFRVMCALPGGRRIIEHVIVELEDGRIRRQVDVEAWD
jgi:hypothetical protein